MQGCWLAASLAQAAFAALAERLPRRPVQNRAAKWRGRHKLDLSSKEQIRECFVNAVGDFTGVYLTAECTNLDRPGAATCRC
jgi:hypothetical protein